MAGEEVCCRSNVGLDPSNKTSKYNTLDTMAYSIHKSSKSGSSSSGTSTIRGTNTMSHTNTLRKNHILNNANGKINFWSIPAIFIIVVIFFLPFGLFSFLYSLLCDSPLLVRYLQTLNFHPLCFMHCTELEFHRGKFSTNRNVFVSMLMQPFNVGQQCYNYESCDSVGEICDGN